MAVIIKTDDAEDLYDEFVKFVDSHISHWYSDELDCFKHNKYQSNNDIYFRASVSESEIVFNIQSNREETMMDSEYAFFHAQIIQTFLFHFDDQCSDITATAKPLPTEHLICQ